MNYFHCTNWLTAYSLNSYGMIYHTLFNILLKINNINDISNKKRGNSNQILEYSYLNRVFKYPLSIPKATGFLNLLSCPHKKGNHLLSSYLSPYPLTSNLSCTYLVNLLCILFHYAISFIKIKEF